MPIYIVAEEIRCRCSCHVRLEENEKYVIEEEESEEYVSEEEESEEDMSEEEEGDLILTRCIYKGKTYYVDMATELIHDCKTGDVIGVWDIYNNAPGVSDNDYDY